MNVGLIDVDSHNFPNLPLMKLSAYHKSIGDHVEMWNGFKHYDKVYMAKVFTDEYTPTMDYCINADEVVTGGTGFDLINKLPNEVEHQYPDYALYDEQRAIGFLTRGCPRQCSFCNVSEQQGKTTKVVADLFEFWHGQDQIVLLDPNITASKDCEKLFKQLIKTKSLIDFSQGLDVRMMTTEKVELLNQMRVKAIHFAWDNYEMQTYEKLKLVRKLLTINRYKLFVYVLTNYNTTHEQDLERVMKLRELEYEPYVMIYSKPTAPKVTKQLQRWVNNRVLWRSCERFEDYGKEQI